MSQTTIALIIIAITMLLFALETFSLATTAMLSMLAMVLTGIISSRDAFACFTNSAVLLIIGLMIMLEALQQAGVMDKIGRLLTIFSKGGEKRFVLILIIIVALLSMFVNNSPLVAVFMPIISAVAASSSGTITKKNTFLPTSYAALIGGVGSLAGSTLPLVSSEMLISTGEDGLGFFEPFPIMLVVLIVIVICYQLFLYKLVCKFFDFEEVKDEPANTEDLKLDSKSVPSNKKNFILSLSVFLACVVLFVVQPFGWDMGLSSIMGAMVLIVTKCIDGKVALQKINWTVVVIVGATLGMAQGFVSSGAGEFIIGWILSLFGDAIYNPVVLLTIFMVTGNLLSMFMYNGSLNSMLCALAIPLAQTIGCDPKPIVMGCFFGVSFAMAMPSASVTLAIVQGAGYRIKDYFRVGAITGTICLVTSWASIILIYGLI